VVMEVAEFCNKMDAKNKLAGNSASCYNINLWFRFVI
jgi:hypothetical protein